MLRARRREVWLSTVETVRARSYEVAGQRVDLDTSPGYETLRNGTVFHAATATLEVPSALRNRHRTLVSVHNADFLEIARAIAIPDRPPAVLSMASRRNPGGGVHQGAGAQEENLFRRSNTLHSLYQFVDYGIDYDVQRQEETSYPIPRESGGIYSPSVTIFRSAETTGYAFLGHPFRVNVITVPAINNPEVVEHDGLPWLTEKMVQATGTKIRAILRIAARHEQTHLVLSAFGCGAFGNPPHHVAQIFREVLGESEFAGVFQRIAFAVIDDHNAFHPASPEGNYVPFERALARS